MNEEKTNSLAKFFPVQNLLTEERNYIEILRGYCENSLAHSDDLNKIYPMLKIIHALHLKTAREAEKFASGF